jgi:hypothetical protein
MGHPIPRGYKYGNLPPQVGESLIWGSKIWSWVPRDSDSRITALARTCSNCKRQICPVVREDAPHGQTRNCLTVIKIWSCARDGAWHQDRLADWPSILTWFWHWLESVSREKVCRQTVTWELQLWAVAVRSWYLRPGQFGNPEEGVSPPFEAVTRQRSEGRDWEH